eukprot:TRINITY_DN5353_c0_g3_i4.p1 TRINITY_DN5353_c0_g3~~TRINITY_DN5353_c0_g3_i4.p1  ORF type:complete len:264 (-),score=42.83 TRINITY_DN5353_c0_g3_i4:52-843(-)
MSRSTTQSRGLCFDFDSDNSTINACKRNSDCVAGSQSENGFLTGVCNTTSGYCIMSGWCPVENDTLPFTEFFGIENFTIFMRSSVSYTEFGIAANNGDRTALGYNIFSVADIIKGQNLTDIKLNGAIVSIKIDWSCNLDISICKPEFKFDRVDGGNKSRGFNFRQAAYLDNDETTGLWNSRIYTKYVGIRFFFEIVGSGRRFDIFSTVLTVGSAAAFLGVATVLVDYIVQLFHPQKAMIVKAKRKDVELEINSVEENKDYIRT